MWSSNSIILFSIFAKPETVIGRNKYLEEKIGSEINTVQLTLLTTSFNCTIISKVKNKIFIDSVGLQNQQFFVATCNPKTSNRKMKKKKMENQL